MGTTNIEKKRKNDTYMFHFYKNNKKVEHIHVILKSKTKK